MKNKTFLVVVIVVALAVFAGLMFWSKTAEKAQMEAVAKADAALLVKPHSPVKGNADAKVTV